MAGVLTEGWEFPLAQAIPVDPYTLDAPVGADGSWVPLPVLRFPEADTYQGTATKATMTFSIPLPDQLGILERWWANRFRNGIIEGAQRQGMTPLVVAAWRDSTPTFSTKYTLTMIVAGASPVPVPIIIGIVIFAVFALGFLITVNMERVENILIGTKGTPAQFVPAGSPAPPGTVDRFGRPVPRGSPAPEGAFIPEKKGNPGLFETVSDLAPLILIGLLVQAFKK